MFTRSIRVVLLGVLLVAGCGDDGFNALPDGPTDGDADNDGIPDLLDNCPNAENANQLDTDADGAGDVCDDDDDSDGVLDGADNCPLVANPDQANGDGDADGDVCDGDADNDGLVDGSDNCPGAANGDQLDTDGDLMGDACDADDDNDTILDLVDNCALVANTAQGDNDDDSLGDACDDDDDNDTVVDTADNCPLDANTNQTNSDTDTLGDACDPDDDDDTVVDTADNCPLDANTNQLNSDTDTLGDACDPDDDDDTVLDGADNCPLDANTDQLDSDTDALGDACDADDDNDGIVDNLDNCVIVANSDQSNLDADAAGDACDPDDDGDGVIDADDNCPSVPNADQSDVDQNGRGDACDGVITPSFNSIIQGGNMVSVGAGNAGRFDGNGGVPGTADPSVDLTIANLPAGAQILTARLYWTVIGTPFPTVTFENTSVTGVEIGQTPDTCWGIGNNFMYRADVTPLITGNATYVASDLLSVEAIAPDGQGISLVIVYKDPADLRNNYVGISDGASVSGGATLMTGFTVGVGFDAATVTTLVADGQPAPDDVQYQGQSFGGGDAYPGINGAMWDNRIDNITSVLAGGETSVSVAVVPQGDCLAWSMSGLVIEDVDDQTLDTQVIKTFLPPSQKTPALQLFAKPAPAMSLTPGTAGYRR